MKMIDDNHSFSPVIAKATKSVQKAILLKEIGGWCQHNYDNGKNIDENGYAWVFMSVGEKDRDKSPKNCFSKKFFYMPKSSIYRWLDDLEKDGWIYSKVDNKKKYDKTKSYRLDFEKYNNAISQNENSVSQNERPNYQNERPIHSLNNSNKEYNIYNKENLDSVEVCSELKKYLSVDQNIENLNNAILKSFTSILEAREFYLAVADEFSTKGLEKYRYKFKNINQILPKFQTWCRNKKYMPNKSIKHRLWQEYTREEFEAGKDDVLRATSSAIGKTRVSKIDMARMMLFLAPMLQKIKDCGKFKSAEPLYMKELIRIYLRYEHKKQQLKAIFEDLSYAPKFKSVWNFIEKRKDFVK